MSDPQSSNPPAPEWLEMLLSYLWEQRGTDLHLTAGSPPLARVDGELHAVPNQPVLTPADTEAFAGALLDETDQKTFEQRGDVDFAFGFDHLARVRGSAYSQRGATTLALRMIPSRVPDMEELGLPEAMQQMVDAPSGLILVTGPTGSGKSTTMAHPVLPRPHHRGPDRVRLPPRPRRRQPAGGRQGHRVLRPGPALRPPGGPRRPHGRRDA